MLIDPSDTEALACRSRSCEGKSVIARRRSGRDRRGVFRREYGEHLCVYRCVFCGLYHLGHQVKAGSWQWQQLRNLWQRRVSVFRDEIIPGYFLEEGEADGRVSEPE